MARLKAAVIGLGRIASTIDEELDDFDGVEFPYGHIPVTCPCPRSKSSACPTRGSSSAKPPAPNGVSRRYTRTTARCWRRPGRNIVSVCTSAKPRGDILLEIANGGYGVRAIWAEKPITLSLAEADAAIDACKRANIALAINCTRRWRDDYLQVNALINEGAIGDVVSRGFPIQVRPLPQRQPPDYDAHHVRARACSLCRRRGGTRRGQPRQRLLGRRSNQVSRQCSRLRAGLRQRPEREFP